MVQRKVGIQADHVNKTQKHLGNLKPGFSQSHHQDGRNRAADMKKKMKKSRSIKLSDIESLRSSPLQPAAAKPSAVRPSDGSPNYMKPTSSSDARKERSQVSPRSNQTVSGSARRLSTNCKVSSASANETARTSSLKLVKTLTKSPSFKPVRASTKVALCADMDAHRATCSSTLKDSKFPEYLMLNSGGTEYEGTSVIRVCPFTYCSLNGHHHAPFPPLKCFLSARRQALKTHKAMKLEALSPRRGARQSGDSVKAIDTRQEIIDGKAALQEVDSCSSAVSPLIQEVGMDFFIEIHAKSRDEATGSNRPDEEMVVVPAETGHLKGIMSSVKCGDKTEKGDELVADSESNAPSVSEIDPEDNLDQISNIVFTEAFSEGSDMDWEEGTEHLDDSTQGSNETNMDSRYWLAIKHPDLYDEPPFKLDDIISKCFEEIFPDAQQEIINDESSCFEVQFSGSDSDADSIDQDLENDESNQMSESSNEEQISSIFNEVAAYEEDNGEAKLFDFFGIHINIGPVEHGIDETGAANNDKGRVSEAGPFILEMYPQVTDDEATNDIQIAGQVMTDYQDSASLQTNQDETNEDFNVGDKTSEDHQFDTIAEGRRLSGETFNETLLEDLKTNHEVGATEFVLEKEFIDGSDRGEKKEKEQAASTADNCKSSQEFSDEICLTETQDDPRDNDVEVKISSSMNLEDQSHSKMKKPASTEDSNGEVDTKEVEDRTKPEAAETCLSSENTSSSKIRTAIYPARSNTNQEPVPSCNKLREAIRHKKPVEGSEETRDFNPREPNYLPLEADPEAEKVDLRHQMMDERKNSEEWMLDFALRKAVTELAPARKRKVALLIEAFETVLPMPKCEARVRHSSAAFTHPRTIQACS